MVIMAVMVKASYNVKCFMFIIQIIPPSNPMKRGFLCMAEEIEIWRI